MKTAKINHDSNNTQTAQCKRNFKKSTGKNMPQKYKQKLTKLYKK